MRRHLAAKADGCGRCADRTLHRTGLNRTRPLAELKVHLGQPLARRVPRTSPSRAARSCTAQGSGPAAVDAVPEVACTRAPEARNRPPDRTQS